MPGAPEQLGSIRPGMHRWAGFSSPPGQTRQLMVTQLHISLQIDGIFKTQ